MYVSITVGRRGCNVFEGWLGRLHRFFQLVCFKAAVGLEVGPKCGNAHLQAVDAVQVAVPFDEACKEISKGIRRSSRSSGGTKVMLR